MARRVLITVAELSGDHHAANLIRELRKLDPEIVVDALGGPNLRGAGATLRHETVQRAAMGLAALGRWAEVRRLLRWTREYYRQTPPDLQICVDSWTMNSQFARLAHDRGVPVLYYIAPQAWASRPGRAKKLRQWVNKLACIHLFEEEYFRRQGIDAKFVGHPLFDQIRPRGDISPRPPLEGRAPVVAIIPGSRRSIAAANFPPLMEVAGRILQVFPGTTFKIPTTAATEPVIRQALAEPAEGGAPLPAGAFEVGLDAFDELIPQCDLCLTVSGTATLHAAAYGVPMIVVYRGNPILWHLIGKWIIRTRTYSLVNLLSDSHEHVVPEFIPWYGSSEPVARCAIEFLQDPRKLAEMSARLRQIVSTIDKPGASRQAAELAMELMTAPAGKDRSG
jgi:lipid-A-disaccharide synthase